MHIERVDLTDAQSIGACDEVCLAAQEADCPEEPRLTAGPFRGWLTVGWDGNPREVWLAAGRPGGSRRPVLGWYRLELPERENQDRANLDLFVHPAERRRGLGTALLRHAAERAAEHGRSVLGPSAPGTARPGLPSPAAAGAEPGVVEVQRILDLASWPTAGWKGCASRPNGPRPATRWCPGPGRCPSSSSSGSHRSTTRSTTPRTTRGKRPRSGMRSGSAKTNARQPQLRQPRLHGCGRARGGRIRGGGGADPGRSGSGRSRLGAPGDHGVTRPHRGHRLGLLVKVAMMDLLTAAEPQVERMSTWNGADKPVHDRGQRSARLHRPRARRRPRSRLERGGGARLVAARPTARSWRSRRGTAPGSCRGRRRWPGRRAARCR